MRVGPTPEERAMKVQEVLVRALAGELTWIQAADILGMSPRSVRRWRLRMELRGRGNLVDRRHRPSPRRVAPGEVRRIARLYRPRYRGFNSVHFNAVCKRGH